MLHKETLNHLKLKSTSKKKTNEHVCILTVYSLKGKNVLYGFTHTFDV